MIRFFPEKLETCIHNLIQKATAKDRAGRYNAVYKIIAAAFIKGCRYVFFQGRKVINIQQFKFRLRKARYVLLRKTLPIKGCGRVPLKLDWCKRQFKKFSYFFFATFFATFLTTFFATFFFGAAFLTTFFATFLTTFFFAVAIR